MHTLATRLAAGPVIFDGAMGSMLYARGVFLNACYEEQCLTNPGLVRRIHEEYVAAGAEVLKTNTFGANRLKLRPHGLVEQVAAINRAGVQLARTAGGQGVHVAGAIGPCSRPGETLPGDLESVAEQAFAEQAAALAEAGVDLLALETFSSLPELELAVRAVRAAGLPILASVRLAEDDRAADGTTAAAVVEALARNPDVALIGFNCGQGPANLLVVAKAVVRLTTKPLIFCPNAGHPREVDGRTLYLNSPEYFTEYCRKAIELGVGGVGGCCGTTPEHIRVMARTVKSIRKATPRLDVVIDAPPRPDAVLAPTAPTSRLAAKLANGQLVTTVEVLPPKSCDLRPLLEKARTAAAAGVDAINIPDGPRACVRISAQVTAIEIARAVPAIEPVLHYCCRDRNLIAMQADLLGSYAAGLKNVLLITGDPPKLGDYPDATGVFDVDAIGLTRLVRNLNCGCDCGGQSLPMPTAFCFGVGANPCAVDPDRELRRLYQKIEAGAQFIITQPVFAVDTLLKFLEAVNRAPRRVAVIAGVWPLVSYRNAEFMNTEVPGVSVPESILRRMAACTTRDEGRDTGIAIARETVHDLRTAVQGFQVSAPLGRLETALAVLKEVLPAAGVAAPAPAVATVSRA